MKCITSSCETRILIFYKTDTHYPKPMNQLPFTYQIKTNEPITFHIPNQWTNYLSHTKSKPMNQLPFTYQIKTNEPITFHIPNQWTNYLSHTKSNFLHTLSNYRKRTNMYNITCLHIKYIWSRTYLGLPMIVKYSETCLNRTSLWPGFEFGIDRCLVYTG
jgi:hypothetical protein